MKMNVTNFVSKFFVPTSRGWRWEAYKFISARWNTWMRSERCCYGFHYNMLTSNLEEKKFDMTWCGWLWPFDQV